MASSIELVESTQSLGTNQNNQLQPRLLLIEHNNNLGDTFLAQINEANYHVTRALIPEEKISDLKAYLLEYNPDMVVLNLCFCTHPLQLLISEIRTHFHGLFVVVSREDGEQDQIEALKLGVDDYFTKPIDNRILTLRIASLFRRKNEKINQVELASLTLGDVCLQPKSQKCFVNGSVTKLTTFEFNLLKLLLEHQGQILSRDQLYHKLLCRTYNGVERTLDVRMSQLREKLTLAGMQKNQIETIWGQGYMFNNITA